MGRRQESDAGRAGDAALAQATAGAGHEEAVGAILAALGIGGAQRVTDSRRDRAAMALQEAWWGMDRVLNEDRLSPERSQALQRGQALVQASAARLQGGIVP